MYNELKPEKSVLFHWCGIDTNNRKIHGTMLAAHRVIVKNELLKQGLRALRIQQKSFRKPVRQLLGKQTITQKHILSVMYQLNTLLKSNIPLLQGLELIMQNDAKSSLNNLLQKIIHSIASGNTLSEAIRAYPMFFRPYCIQLIAIGEKTGSLSTVCQHIVTYMENMQQFKKKLVQALFYPCLLFIVSFAIMMLLLLFVIPQFEEIFHAYHAKLPMMTHSIIQLSHSLQKLSYYQILCICFGLLIISRTPIKIRYGHTITAHFFTYIPWVRQIIIYYSLTRFFQTLHITYRFGIPIKDALHLSIETLLLTQQKRSLQSACKLLKQGETILKAFESFHWPLPMTLPILDTAQSSGKLDTILEHLSRCYGEQTEHLMGITCHLLEPLLMIILGILIGTIVVGLYLPLFQLGMHF